MLSFYQPTTILKISPPRNLETKIFSRPQFRKILNHISKEGRKLEIIACVKYNQTCKRNKNINYIGGWYKVKNKRGNLNYFFWKFWETRSLYVDPSLTSFIIIFGSEIRKLPILSKMCLLFGTREYNYIQRQNVTRIKKINLIGKNQVGRN